MLLARGNVPSALFNACGFWFRRLSVCVERARDALLSYVWELLRVFSLTLEARAVVAVSDRVGLLSPVERGFYTLDR